MVDVSVGVSVVVGEGVRVNVAVAVPVAVEVIVGVRVANNANGDSHPAASTARMNTHSRISGVCRERIIAFTSDPSWIGYILHALEITWPK